jgi:hypothetical protein
MNHVQLLIMGLVLSGSLAIAADPPKDTPDATKLIKQLGSPRYQVREDAALKLTEMGRHAKAALLIGSQDPDPEIAFRCQRLLPIAVAADLKLRIDAFVADKAGKEEHDLPGWKRFRELVGNDAETRQVFIDMVRNSTDIFEIFELNPQDGHGHFARKCNEIIFGISNGTPVRSRNGSQTLNATDMITIFFFGSDPEAAKAVPNKGLLGNILWQPGFQTTVKAENAQGKIMRKLFFTWVKANQEPQLLNQVLSIVQQMNLKEGLEIAEGVATSKVNAQFVRAQALLILGKMGEVEKHEKILQALLKDDTLVSNFNNGQFVATTQIRDIALAMIIILRKQEPKDFGFEFVTHTSLKFAYYYLGFVDDKKRDEARKKWDEWVAKQPKK